MVTKLSNKRALFAFIFILTFFLFLADFLVITTQRQHLLENYGIHSTHETTLLGNAIKESLLKNDYANVERFINDWGTGYDEVIEISIQTKNGFQLASYERSEIISAHILPIEQTFTYGDDKFFTINLVKDGTLIHESINQLSNRLIISSILFVLILGMLMWKTLETTAIRPLRKEIN